MLEGIQKWISERPGNPPGLFSLLSLLLFTLLCLVSAVLLTTNSYLWWLFGILVVVDVLGMLASADSIVSVDSALFFLVVVIASIARSPSNVFLLTLEILALIAALDFSFLLRKVNGTGVDRSVFANRLKSYVYTSLPAFLLTYLLLFVYSQNLGFALPEAVIALGLATAAALIIIYSVVHFLLSFNKKNPYLRD